MDSSAIIWGVGSSSLTLPIPDNCPKGFKLLLKQCWSAKPRNRPSFRQILMHLDIASSDLCAIEPNHFLYIQDQWKSEIRSCIKQMKRRRSSVGVSNEDCLYDEESLHQQENNDYVQVEKIENLILKRKDELLLAQEIREEYERKRECANNLYTQLMACLLKLEQREKELLQREQRLSHKLVINTLDTDTSNSLVKKVPQVLSGPDKAIYSGTNSDDTDSDERHKEPHSKHYMRKKKLKSAKSHSRLAFTDPLTHITPQNSPTKNVGKKIINCKSNVHRRSLRRHRGSGSVCQDKHSVQETTLSSCDSPARNTPRPKALINEFDYRKGHIQCSERATQTDTNTLNISNPVVCEADTPSDQNKSPDGVVLSSPSYSHTRLTPKMSSTSTFDSGYGDGYQSCLSTPSTYSTRIRFSDKSPVTPISIKSGFDNDFEIEETNSLSNGKSSNGRIKCRQSNSNTLPSLSSIDENVTTEEIEGHSSKASHSFFTIQNNRTEFNHAKVHDDKINIVKFDLKPKSEKKAWNRKPDGHELELDSDSWNIYEYKSSGDESVAYSNTSITDDENQVPAKFDKCDKYQKAISQFNQSSQRYCESLTSSCDDTDGDGNDRAKISLDNIPTSGQN